jgi:hypothetical protein
VCTAFSNPGLSIGAENWGHTLAAVIELTAVRIDAAMWEATPGVPCQEPMTPAAAGYAGK